VEENKLELKRAWFDKKILILKQIPTSGAARIHNVVKLPKAERWKTRAEHHKAEQWWTGDERHKAKRWKVGLSAIQFVKPGVERYWDKAEQ